jgi:hypothetical protein
VKRFKILRIIGIAVTLSLLIAAVPATPVAAQWYAMALTPAQGAVGDTISVSGTGFPATSDPSYPQYVLLYFSSQNADVGQSIGTQVTKYRTVAQVATDYQGQFTLSFAVPSTFTDASNVVPGAHYIYACMPQAMEPQKIQGKTTFTVIGGGEISININQGTVDTLVEITGTGFSGNQPVAVEFGGDDINIEEGNTNTGTAGNFVSYVAVPEIRAGTHNINVTVGTGTTAIVKTVVFTVIPEIIISPQSGEVGTPVTVIGTGFARRELVDVYYASSHQVVTDLLTDTRGSFYTTFNIPEIAGLAAGPYNIEAEDAELNLASIPFTLVVVPPTEPTETQPTQTQPTQTQPTQTQPETNSVPLNISASGNIIGSLIGISGAGFAPNTNVLIKYDDDIIATTTSDSAGLIVATFYAPVSTAGEHIISATDGTVTGTTTFIMESMAPPIPTELSPATGDSAKSPVSFDWEDVQDNSSRPVSYMFQIATNDSFSDDSIVLEKIGLQYSEYTLNDEEETEFGGKEEPYYWRVQAVDSASNESGWTDALEVYIAPPFSFPKWLTYTLLSVGAVVIFIIGYWLGRRTAFMY